MNTLHPAKRNRLLIFVVCTIFAFPFYSYGDDFDLAIEKIASYRFGDNREILSTIEDFVRSSSGNTSERNRIEKEFSRLLRSDASYECKDFICRQLWKIGTEESIPALAALLADSTTSDIARYALQENPSDGAGSALRDAIQKTNGLALIGIINSIGNRGDTKSVTLLSSCIFDTDKYSQDVALAAIAALGRIPSNDAGKVLAKARNSGCPVRSDAASQALLLWADTFFADSNK